LTRDIHDDDFYDEVADAPTYDTVVMNPPFTAAMYGLSLASEIIRRDGRNRVIALLPTDYFTSAERRMRSVRALHLDVVDEYRVGRWAYLDGLPTQKPQSDSVFVFRRSTRPTFRHRVHDVRLSGKLTPDSA